MQCAGQMPQELIWGSGTQVQSVLALSWGPRDQVSQVKEETPLRVSLPTPAPPWTIEKHHAYMRLMESASNMVAKLPLEESGRPLVAMVRFINLGFGKGFGS